MMHQIERRRYETFSKLTFLDTDVDDSDRSFLTKKAKKRLPLSFSFHLRAQTQLHMIGHDYTTVPKLLQYMQTAGNLDCVIAVLQPTSSCNSMLVRRVTLRAD